MKISQAGRRPAIDSDADDDVRVSPEAALLEAPEEEARRHVLDRRPLRPLRLAADGESDDAADVAVVVGAREPVWNPNRFKIPSS